MNQGVQELEATFSSLLATMTVEAARNHVLEEAKNNSNISSATLSSGTLFLIFKGLIPVIVDLSDPNSPPMD
ncbi:hypothetical protein [Desulfogranum mediterraneum]|uniref:hypothetical protein n=1 Tax=Desulfogranum mediterraneum TaxID=160661 RepID=UPI001294694F|nr:hypothetical protein [Desulfogranum mediterraneum]